MVPREIPESMVKRLRVWSLVKQPLNGHWPYTKEATVNIIVVELGTIISSDGTIVRELSAWIQKTSGIRGAFSQLSNIWKNRNIQSYIKIRIYKAAVLTISLYDSEVWNTTKKQLHRLEVFNQRCLRRILRIRWLDRVRNTEVLERAKINSVETYIGANRLRCHQNARHL